MGWACCSAITAHGTPYTPCRSQILSNEDTGIHLFLANENKKNTAQGGEREPGHRRREAGNHQRKRIDGRTARAIATAASRCVLSKGRQKRHTGLKRRE